MAARSLGASHARIIWKHILPNLIQSALVIGTFAIGRGPSSRRPPSPSWGLGVPSLDPDLGRPCSRNGRTYISTAWWMAAVPGLSIFATRARDQPPGDGGLAATNLDPKLKRSGARH